MKLRKMEYKLIKTDAGELIVKLKDKVNKQIESLEAGIYKVTIEKEDTDIVQMKKYYFAMESKLASFLGIKKMDLHNILKQLGSIGFKPDSETGKMVYESITLIKDTESMMQRIHEFQQWAILEWDFEFEPFNP